MRSLKNIQTRDYIVNAIREEILAGHMEPQEELAQESLAEMLGVSRMPVREALQALVQEGFAVRLPNRHIQAVVPDAEQIRDIFRVIAVTEAEYLILGMEKGAGLGELKRTAEALDPAEGEEKIRLEMEFHALVLELPGNQYLAQAERRVLDGYAAYAVKNLGEKSRTGRILRGLVLAAEEGDTEQVRRGFREYYEMYAEEFTARWNR